MFGELPPALFLLLVLLAIVGTLVTVFFGVGALTGTFMPVRSRPYESRWHLYLRRTLGAVDVLCAVASFAALLLFGAVATLVVLLGTDRPLVIIVPLIGSAMTGGTFVAAALAQFLGKRHRWHVQVVAVAVAVMAFGANAVASAIR